MRAAIKPLCNNRVSGTSSRRRARTMTELEASMAKGSKSFPIGRNAETGRLTTVKVAREHPKDHVVERMPKPGRGDAKE